MTPEILAVNALVLWGWMSLACVLARSRQRLDTVDTAWGIGFMLAASSTVAVSPHRSRALLTAWLLVLVWGGRLSWHIYRRNRRRSDDPRYRELSQRWRGNFWRRAYVSVFLVQGALIWVICLPLVMLARTGPVAWGPLAMAGTLLWLAGFAIEAAADRQLSGFLKRPDHPKVMDTGLWRYSRHPNYFGELLQWWSIGLIALEAPYGYIGLIGPLTLSLLIVSISGIPPIERRRHDPAYQAYRRRTSVLVPWPPRAAR